MHIRVEESSDKVLEVEKRLQEERRRCVLLEQQLEKLQMDPGRNTSTQKPPLRGKTGEVELLPTAMSPIPPQWLIAAIFGLSSLNPTRVLDLTHRDLDLLRAVGSY